jgi:hypothetical protein
MAGHGREGWQAVAPSTRRFFDSEERLTPPLLLLSWCNLGSGFECELVSEAEESTPSRPCASSPAACSNAASFRLLGQCGAERSPLLQDERREEELVAAHRCGGNHHRGSGSLCSRSSRQRFGRGWAWWGWQSAGFLGGEGISCCSRSPTGRVALPRPDVGRRILGQAM